MNRATSNTQVLSYALAPSVHAVNVRDDLVVLDVLADAYYCLAGVGDAAAVSEDGRFVRGHTSALSSLLEAKLLSYDPVEEDRPRAPAPLDRNLRREWRGERRTSLASLLDVMATGWRAHRDIRRLSFAQLVEAARREPVNLKRRTRLPQAVAAFDATRPWAPFDGDCLFRAYWQLLFLRRLGVVGVRWVFGVRTFPFFAHCWLQREDLVLSDDPDALAGYRRIMVV
ncbi:lasso peptide biosynthesis B2 protein [Caulobacter sp. 73W]|uniref:Lasso peptide biosynthesis B2 protein n=1 Tax=Caulobacter sp. 73W TaxID=3161137 RepID=A0AB39KRA6_9CAUL